MCYRHYQQSYRKKNPELYAYRALKANAKRRGKHFDLTFEQFKEFCVRTKYLVGKGIEKDSFTIDRVEEHLGYTVSNLQVLTNSQNVKKRYLQYNWVEKSFTVVNGFSSQDIDDNPF